MTITYKGQFYEEPISFLNMSIISQTPHHSRKSLTIYNALTFLFNSYLTPKNLLKIKTREQLNNVY